MTPPDNFTIGPISMEQLLEVHEQLTSSLPTTEQDHIKAFMGQFYNTVRLPQTQRLYEATGVFRPHLTELANLAPDVLEAGALTVMYLYFPCWALLSLFHQDATARPPLLQALFNKMEKRYIYEAYWFVPREREEMAKQELYAAVGDRYTIFPECYLQPGGRTPYTLYWDALLWKLPDIELTLLRASLLPEHRSPPTFKSVFNNTP